MQVTIVSKQQKDGISYYAVQGKKKARFAFIENSGFIYYWQANLDFKKIEANCLDLLGQI